MALMSSRAPGLLSVTSNARKPAPYMTAATATPPRGAMLRKMNDGSGLEETGQDVGHGEDRFLEEPTGRPTWRDESSRAEPGIPNVDTA